MTCAKLSVGLLIVKELKPLHWNTTSTKQTSRWVGSCWQSCSWTNKKNLEEHRLQFERTLLETSVSLSKQHWLVDGRTAGAPKLLLKRPNQKDLPQHYHITMWQTMKQWLRSGIIIYALIFGHSHIWFKMCELNSIFDNGRLKNVLHARYIDCSATPSILPHSHDHWTGCTVTRLPKDLHHGAAVFGLNNLHV